MNFKSFLFLFLFLVPIFIQDNLVTETFESGNKSGYKDEQLTLSSGNWLLSDALLGNSPQDAKNGIQSVRIRNAGKLSLLTDRQVAAVSISYGVYGHDGPSTWQLWLSYDNGRSYQQCGTTVTASAYQLQSLIFRIKKPGKLRFEIRKISGGSNRINIDDISFMTEPAQLKPGKVIPIAKGAIDNSNLLLGNPSNATTQIGNTENYLLDQFYYTESYNKAKACPNWVSWHIGKTDLGSTDRLDNFRPDNTLPQGWYEADNTSYRNSGFDKGHNCPSADRTSSTAANSATFLMDNIIPQAPNNNQHTWEHLEAYCRDQVKNGMEVYVIMESYGTGGTGKNGYATTIDHGRINVPAHIWKVVVVMQEGDHDLQRINASTRVIAIDTPNDNGVVPNWMNYLCTVRDIEKATGYDLLSALPKAVQDVVELKKFAGGN